MWSTWQPNQVSSSWIRQYSQRKPARRATRARIDELTSGIGDLLASSRLDESHKVFELEVVIELGRFFARQGGCLLPFHQVGESRLDGLGRLKGNDSIGADSVCDEINELFVGCSRSAGA